MKKVLPELLVLLAALAVGIYGELPALTHPYVIADDVKQATYWMRQFRDPSLFPNDLLTEYTKNYQPWGVVALYYLLSPFFDPLVTSKILPLILFPLSSLFLFKWVERLANRYAGFLAGLLFMTTSTYLETIVGGFGRSFGFLLLILFLYELAREKYLNSSLLLVLQSLFYPVLFFVSALTGLLLLIEIRDRRIQFAPSFPKAAFLILGILLSLSLLGAKQLLSPHALIGRIVTRGEMLHHGEYYENGRTKVLPTEPLLQEIGRNIRRGFLTSPFVRKNPVVDRLRAAHLQDTASFLAVLFLLFGFFRMKLRFPKELFALFLASALMYKISDLFLFQLFLPSRYLEYSIPLISLIIFSMAAGVGIGKIKGEELRKSAQIAGILIFSFLNFDIEANALSVNLSSYAGLYRYLKTLPKETLIAAHPDLADGIPAFAQRKVFIQHKLSHPFFGRYWAVVKKRTFDFFKAYYSKNSLSLYQFCRENKIDYLVVDKKYFTEAYLGREKIYFEPFGSYLKKRIGKRKDFALNHVLERDKLFSQDDLFVISRESLKPR